MLFLTLRTNLRSPLEEACNEGKGLVKMSFSVTCHRMVKQTSRDHSISSHFALCLCLIMCHNWGLFKLKKCHAMFSLRTLVSCMLLIIRTASHDFVYQRKNRKWKISRKVSSAEEILITKQNWATFSLF